MLLIVEIILTFFAWRNGWKWLALLPIGICFALGLLIGFMIGMSGGDIDNVSALGTVLDLIAIVALVVMVSKKPKNKGKQVLND